MRQQAPPVPVDPFDLPDFLGSGSVTWHTDDGLGGGHLVHGALHADPGRAADVVVCDLLAVDDAYPRPVTDDVTRSAAHQAWRHGQVHLVAYDDRLTLLVPGTTFTAEQVLQALRRLALALGARPSDFSALLRLGD